MFRLHIMYVQWFVMSTHFFALSNAPEMHKLKIVATDVRNSQHWKHIFAKTKSEVNTEIIKLPLTCWIWVSLLSCCPSYRSHSIFLEGESHNIHAKHFIVPFVWKIATWTVRLDFCHALPDTHFVEHAWLHTFTRKFSLISLLSTVLLSIVTHLLQWEKLKSWHLFKISNS